MVISVAVCDTLRLTNFLVSLFMANVFWPSSIPIYYFRSAHILLLLIFTLKFYVFWLFLAPEPIAMPLPWASWRPALPCCSLRLLFSLSFGCETTNEMHPSDQLLTISYLFNSFRDVKDSSWGEIWLHCTEARYVSTSMLLYISALPAFHNKEEGEYWKDRWTHGQLNCKHPCPESSSSIIQLYRFLILYTTQIMSIPGLMNVRSIPSLSNQAGGLLL